MPIYTYISLGSNAGNAAEILQQAQKRLAAMQNVDILRISSIYETEPQEFKNQPWFLNQVIKLDIHSWSPETFLQKLLELEKEAGRVRSPNPALRYGPRTLDLDLLLHGQTQQNSRECTLPHPRMLKRAFVLVPLLEIDPLLEIEGKKIANWLEQLSWRMDGNKIFQN